MSRKLQIFTWESHCFDNMKISFTNIHLSNLAPLYTVHGCQGPMVSHGQAVLMAASSSPLLIETNRSCMRSMKSLLGPCWVRERGITIGRLHPGGRGYNFIKSWSEKSQPVRFFAIGVPYWSYFPKLCFVKIKNGSSFLQRNPKGQ